MYQIIDIPEILVLGREKYIDRNVKTFERNNLNIPLHLVYCISARNNEKNIDFSKSMVYTVSKWSKRVAKWSKMEWR